MAPTHIADGKEVLCFASNAKPPFHMLSNYFECPVEVGGVCYNSSEARYQATFAGNAATQEACAQGGAFATLDFLPERKRKYWSKKRMVGMAVKMATSMFNEVASKYRFVKRKLTYEEARDIWAPILRAKYAPGSDLARLLQGTGDRLLLERVRFKGSTWGGRVKDGEVEGGNWMGKLLMERRDELNA